MIRVILLAVLGASATAVAQAPRTDTVVLSLPALVATALRNNIDLRAAAAGPRFAVADLLAARGEFDPALTLATDRSRKANDVRGVSPRATQASGATLATLGALLPTGSEFALSLQRSSLSSDPFTLSPTVPFPTSHASSLNLSFVQPLLRGLGRTGTYGFVDAASTAIEAAQQRYERSADVTVALVERAYWLLRQAETNESVLQRSVDASRAIFERNRALRDRDVATTLDVLTSERGLATRETQLWSATRQRVDAAERLLFLVYGEDARDGALLQAARARTSSDSAIVPVVPALSVAEALALALRGDGMAARRDVEAGIRRAAQTKSQRLPRLDLIGSYGYGGTAASSRFLSFGDSSDIRSSSWSLGLSASLFQRNDAASALDQRAEAALDVARMARAGMENTIVAEVRSAVRGLQTERDRYLRAADVMRLAEQEYAAAREGARLALITTFQLLQYEEQLASARLLAAQARFALEDAGTQYRLAIGGSRRYYGIGGAK